VKEFDSKLALKDAEISDLRQRLLRNGTVVTPDTNGTNTFCLFKILHILKQVKLISL